jgi:LysW-gamma-L-lysine carboxypeptidase
MTDELAVSLLRAMVETPSLSRQEANVASLLVRAMRELGMNAQVDDAGNAVGATFGDPLRPVAGVRDIVLLGHMDVVPGEVPVRIEGDLLYGRGSVDAKGPLATFVGAATRARLPEGYRVVVIGAVEEEIATSAGARAARARYAPAACVIGEPSRWDSVTIGYKGRLLVRYSLTREVCHSAAPHPSAGDELVAWWSAVNAKVRHLNEGRSGGFQLLQATMRSMRTDSDGLTDTASGLASFRLPPWFTPDEVRSLCVSLAGDARLEYDGEEHTFVADRASPLARSLTACIRAEGARPALVMKSGTCDMNVVGAPGWWTCPIVAYGPGDSTLDHTPNEHVSVSEYLRAIRVLAGAIERFATEQSETPGEGSPGAGRLLVEPKLDHSSPVSTVSSASS